MGSLFKTREIWSVKLDDEEGFHCNSLIVANIDNSSPGSEKIIVGSLKGILRIYLIHGTEYTASDLLLETDLGLPILQVSVGKLLPASNNLTLVILHPRKFSVYSVSGTAGLSEQGCNYNILLMYEHVLQRSAYNMVLGPFGKIQGKDFICVQALDGTLSFYEQESFAFSRFLPNYLLPGPIGYDPINDSFIIATVSRTVESYRYQVLAIAKDEDDSGLVKQQSTTLPTPSTSKHRGRRVVPDWSCMIGETAMEICILPSVKNHLNIIVLGEHNLFLLTETGDLIFARKFDFNPLAICSYKGKSGNLMMLIASEYNSLLIFSHNRIKWIAQMSSRAITLVRSTILNTPGVLISLSDTGELNAFYLGTHPSFSFANISPTFHKIDYEATEIELKELTKTIKNFNHMNSAHNNSASAKTAPKTEDLIILIDELDLSEDKFSQTMQVTLKIDVNTADKAAYDVRVTINPPNPIAFFAGKAITIFPSIDAGSSVSLNVILALDNNLNSSSKLFLPANLKLTVAVLYSKSADLAANRVLHRNYNLPLRMVCHTVGFLNVDYLHSLSFDLLGPESITLQDLLPSVIDSSFVNTEVALAMHTTPESHVNVSLSSRKNSSKLQLRSSTYESLMFVTVDMIRLLLSHGCKIDPTPVDKSCLKLESFFSLIDSYSQIKGSLIEVQSSLETQSGHFKSIIKRILIKLKDRNPASLNKLDVMLERLQSKLFTLTDQAIDLQSQMRAITNSLHASSSVLAHLLTVVTGNKSEIADLLRLVFATDDTNGSNNDWGKQLELAIEDVLVSRGGNTGKVDLADVANAEFSPRKLKSLIESLVNIVYKGELQDRPHGGKSLTQSTNVPNDSSSSPPPPGPVFKSNFISSINSAIPEEDEDEMQNIN